MGKHHSDSKKQYQKRRKSAQMLKKKERRKSPNKTKSLPESCELTVDHKTAKCTSQCIYNSRTETEVAKYSKCKVSDIPVGKSLKTYLSSVSGFNKSQPRFKRCETVQFDYERDSLYTKWLTYKSLNQQMKQIEYSKNF